MSKTIKVPIPKNEEVLAYAPNSKERIELKKTLGMLRNEEKDIAMYINGQDVRTGNKVRIHPPHEIKHTLGYFHKGDAEHVQMAIDAAMKAKHDWANMDWEDRAAIFLKAASLIAGPYRARLNAATMLGQSKSAHQAEIDAACEMIDFLRFNVKYMSEIYARQPESSDAIWNQMEQRPLEGFVFALTPFNFTSIAGNLPTAPAMMGNTIVWKPSNQQIYSARVLMDIFTEAGLPAGVINLVFVSGPVAGKVIFEHRDFAGIHFTGSTSVFNHIWKSIGENISKYKSYPRIVGETGGKNFVLIHPSANIMQSATAITRGAFEYQGQKCSAASRIYVPESIWPEIKQHILDQIASIKIGAPEHLSNFMNAVIDEASFDKLSSYIERAKKSKEVEVIAGGNCDKSVGYFIEPTVLLCSNPRYETMEEELFGPVVSIYVYPDAKWSETIDLVDSTSVYGLTGSVFARDRAAVNEATDRLINAAGNFYVNDKPTGAVVAQQPFGGSRASGTNDKAGSELNLLRWVSPRTIKETFLPAEDYKYPFLDKGECKH